MDDLKQNRLFLVIVGVLFFLILGEIGFLGYKFWTVGTKESERTPQFTPQMEVIQEETRDQISPLFQLINGWVEEIEGQLLTLVGEQGKRTILTLAEDAEILKQGRIEEPIFMINIFRDDFSSGPEVSEISLSQVQKGDAVAVILELQWDSSYLGKKLVVLKVE